ncbi:MAG: hypothetical protein CME06_09490 [Gemmatimonadetes bacterium]|nr:hypothetical protein [Gemmatimonadota bacterium]
MLRFVHPVHLSLIAVLLGAAPDSSADEEALPAFDRLWNYSDPAATETAFREILPRAEKSDELSYRVELLTQIARAEGLQGKSEAAHATLDQAERLLPPEGMARARLRYFLERGRAHNGIPGATDPEVDARKSKARPYFIQAWELAGTAKEDALALDAAHMMGIIEPPARALEWSERALDLAEKTADPRARGWLGPLYNNIGWAHHDAGDYDKALALFRKGVDFHAERGPSRQLRIAKWTVARTLRSLGRLDEALGAQESLLDEWKSAGEDSPYVIEELGECLHALGRVDEARPHFREAHELLSKDEWLSENEPERIERLKKMGDGG